MDKNKHYIELGLNKLIGLVYLTDELLENTKKLEKVIIEGFAKEFGYVIDESIL